jgi:hypothetical protein
MKCAYCGDDIRTDEEYYHFPNIDINYHIDCLLPSELMLKKQRRIKEPE